MEYPIIRRILFPIIGLWIKKIEGTENIPRKGAFIIAANHSSYLDHYFLIYVVVPLLDKKLHFLAKKEHFNSLVERAWHTHGGAIPLDREKGGKEALGLAVKALREGKIIGIYPEGTRSLTGKLQKAKTGAARLAIKSGVPILPVGLTGTFRILPKGKHIPKMKRAAIKIGRPIYLGHHNKKINKRTLRLATTRIMKEIAKLCGQEYDF